MMWVFPRYSLLCPVGFVPWVKGRLQMLGQNVPHRSRAPLLLHCHHPTHQDVAERHLGEGVSVPVVDGIFCVQMLVNHVLYDVDDLGFDGGPLASCKRRPAICVDEAQLRFGPWEGSGVRAHRCRWLLGLAFRLISGDFHA
jgi:hypothetical protein